MSHSNKRVNAYPSGAEEGKYVISYHVTDNAGNKECKTIYVGRLCNLPAEQVMTEIVVRHFGEFGPIESVRVLKSKGCAFVTYKLRCTAVRAPRTPRAPRAPASPPRAPASPAAPGSPAARAGGGGDSALARLLASLQCEHYQAKLEHEEIDVETLAILQEKDLESFGIPKGPRLKIMRAAATWRVSGDAAL